MFTEDDLLPISALQHLIFCERQCALIHIERVWVENRLTVEGRQLHRKAHTTPGPRGGGLADNRPGVRVARAVPLRSLRLGLVGVADVVEFHAPVDLHDSQGDRAPARPFPVEYKRGRPKSHWADRVQLAAQALCLEEMLGVDVPGGALFYGRTRRRKEVPFDTALRGLTERAAERLHAMIASGRTPIAHREAKCERCSLIAVCTPEAADKRPSAARYVELAVAEHLTIEEGEP